MKIDRKDKAARCRIAVWFVRLTDQEANEIPVLTLQGQTKALPNSMRWRPVYELAGPAHHSHEAMALTTVGAAADMMIHGTFHPGSTKTFFDNRVLLSLTRSTDDQCWVKPTSSG